MIIDPKLQSLYSLKAAVEIAKLAESCLAKNPKERPKMSEVVERLRRAVEMDPIVDCPPGDKLETGRRGANAMPSTSRTRKRF
jgi:hypothetical protein